MNSGEGLNMLYTFHLGELTSAAFDHNFTAWLTFEALRILYICPIVMKSCMNDSK